MMFNREEHLTYLVGNTGNITYLFALVQYLGKIFLFVTAGPGPTLTAPPQVAGFTCPYVKFCKKRGALRHAEGSLARSCYGRLF